MAGKRCVLTVAVGGEYPRRQQQLIESVRRHDPELQILSWTNEYPPGSPSHQDVPYGFKVYAVQAAMQRGFESLLWLDARCVCIRSLAPIFEQLEQQGHYIIEDCMRLGEWCADGALVSLGLTREESMRPPLVIGSCFGFNTLCARTQDFLRQWKQHCDSGTFNYAAINDINLKRGRLALGDRAVAHISDDMRVVGHRHDEAVTSALAFQLQMELARQGEYWVGGHPGWESHPTAIVINLG